MKAIFFQEHGDLSVLKYADLPEPKPKAGEALIKVKAVALNHLDIWVRRGWKGLRLELPHITGSDVVGEIVSVNATSKFKPGARVIINPGINLLEDEWTRRGEDSVSPGYRILGEHVKGGLAQYLTVPIQNVFEAPANLSDADLCAPILAGTTCWRMLFKQGQLRAGETVLVVGAGGGVNSLAIALAKAAGAEIYALTSSKEKAKKAESLGAKYVVNYKDNPDWAPEIIKLSKGRGIDLVIDNVGAATITNSLRVVRRGGRIVTVGNTTGYNITFDNRMLFSKQVSIIGSTVGSRPPSGAFRDRGMPSFDPFVPGRNSTFQ
jgi:NADPH:quinone reductase-like Zn-dependent oxidoreductase